MRILIICIILVCKLPVLAQSTALPHLSATFHKSNRDRLRMLMPENSVAIIFAAPKKKKSNDIYYTYSPDPNFYYLTGLKETNAVLFIFKNEQYLDSIKTNEIIFVPQNKAADEIWEGKRMGIDGVKNTLRFKYAYPNSVVSSLNMPYDSYDMILGNPSILLTEDDTRNRGDLASMWRHIESDLESDSTGVNEFEFTELMAELRQNKKPEEIKLIKRACSITADAHNELMRSVKPGMPEYRAQAIVEYMFTMFGAQHKGFPSICGTGDNACILHYSDNQKISKSGELMLVDIGAEYNYYTADVTRTFPINGKFTDEQKQLYEIVLNAEKEAINLCHPGQKFAAPHKKAIEIIAQGLKGLGIIKETKDVFNYYMHGTNHYLGLDVHDAGLYGSFESNQVVAIEPGIYIPTGSDCDKKWWGIGIRIEDNILITNGGPENLTEDAPTEISEIEALMSEDSAIFR